MPQLDPTQAVEAVALTHDCVAVINASLKAYGAAVSTIWGGKASGAPIISTYRMDGKRKRTPAVIASFCPFCGGRLSAVPDQPTQAAEVEHGQ